MIYKKLIPLLAIVGFCGQIDAQNVPVSNQKGGGLEKGNHKIAGWKI
jgi:hypothetical protein